MQSIRSGALTSTAMRAAMILRRQLYITRMRQPGGVLLDHRRGPCEDFHYGNSSAEFSALSSLASLRFPSSEGLRRRRAPCFDNHSN